MSLSILMINFNCWMVDFTDAPFAGWLLYWFGWFWFELGAVEGCVPGFALQPSVAPSKGEQPCINNVSCQVRKIL